MFPKHRFNTYPKSQLILLLVFAFLVTFGCTRVYAYDVSVGYGLNLGQDMEAGGAGDLEFSSGHSLRFTFGNIAEPLRFEYEFFYRTLEPDKLNPSTGPTTSVSGDLTQFGLSLNFVERLNAISFGDVIPFWGVGAGGSLLSASNIKAGDKFRVDESAAVFNYQFMLGMDYQFNNHFNASIDFRWVDFGSTGLENSATTTTVELSPEAAPELGIQLRYDF